jgi:hypothetical protein
MTEPRPKCEHCEEKREAVCFGVYEGGEHAYACDECCGHEQGDGHCDSVDSIVQPCCLEILGMRSDKEGLVMLLKIAEDALLKIRDQPIAFHALRELERVRKRGL